MNITVSLDTADWEAALDEMVRACIDAGREASVEGAKEIQDRTQESLTRLSHAPHTKTPSAPGDPPAAISTDLAVSVVVDESNPDYVDVGPTTDYGRIQELGGPMHGHPYMHWREDGRWHRARLVELPERPYLKPATDDVIDSGELLDIYYRHWADAQATVTRP